MNLSCMNLNLNLKKNPKMKKSKIEIVKYMTLKQENIYDDIFLYEYNLLTIDQYVIFVFYHKKTRTLFYFLI